MSRMAVHRNSRCKAGARAYSDLSFNRIENANLKIGLPKGCDKQKFADKNTFMRETNWDSKGLITLWNPFLITLLYFLFYEIVYLIASLLFTLGN